MHFLADIFGIQVSLDNVIQINSAIFCCCLYFIVNGTVSDAHLSRSRSPFIYFIRLYTRCGMTMSLLIEDTINLLTLKECQKFAKPWHMYLWQLQSSMFEVSMVGMCKPMCVCCYIPSFDLVVCWTTTPFANSPKTSSFCIYNNKFQNNLLHSIVTFFYFIVFPWIEWYCIPYRHSLYI